MVPTWLVVALAGGGGGVHVCGSGSGRRWWWCPRVWQWQAGAVVPTCVVVEGSGSDAYVWQWKAVWW